ncbi:MAG: glycine C-acetyltransferase [Myxococcales bacterium]|nr:MAG: glycine C-acetyltransferase [Myxococcales bacterium]
MLGKMQGILEQELKEIREAGLWKAERVIRSPQRAVIKVGDGEAINMCANNYLGLSDHPALVEAASRAMRERGFGMSSVRFICGTLDIHKELEAATAKFLGKEDAILYCSCFDANGGLFETLLGEQDAIISDELNHASIIDGVRLCKAQRYRYKNSDMNDLEERLKEADKAGARVKMIATDGVFSMDGYIAKLDEVCDLAEKYGALVMVDDSHASGFMGKTGRGSIEYRGVMKRVDIVTSTFGKAMGGASGGFTAAGKLVVDKLRQRSRPYLFSNALAPSIVAATLKCIEMLSESTALRDKLERNTKYFRAKMAQTGFTVLPGEHPITPVMLGDAKLANDFADKMLKEGIYVIGFSYPVVPKGKARIRTQISAAHETEHLDRAIAAFVKVGKTLGVI